MTLQPTADRVLIKRDAAEAMSATGRLHIPDRDRERPITGRVIAVGVGRRNDDGVVLPVLLEPGDKVWFGKYAGGVVQLDGEEYLLMSESKVLGYKRGQQ